MGYPYPIDLGGLKRYSLRQRRSKATVGEAASPLKKGITLRDFIDGLPDFLQARDLRVVARAVVEARKAARPVILGMGAHPIKVGLNPILIQLLKEEIVTAVATNGAAIIHDFELAFAGQTSEDVREALEDGSFGMAKETAVMLNRAINEGVKRDRGIGEVVGEMIAESEFPHRDLSLFGCAWRLGVPATVHVAMGTDIIHMHPEFDGASTGRAAEIDFKRFVSLVAGLEGGVFINLGSAVMIPEVFLKALSLVRNLGYRVQDFTTVTLDFQYQYRARVNVVERPTSKAGRGYYLIGPHEILLPLLVGAIIEYY